MFAVQRKIAGLATVAALAFAAPALAMEPEAPTSQAVSVPAPSAKTEDLSLARQYFAAIDFEASLGAILARLTAPEQLGARTSLTTDEREAITSSAAEAMDEALPVLMNEAARITAATFTEAQLKDMIAFYKSDSGKAIAEKTSVLPPMTSQLVLTFAPIIRADVVMRACAKIDCEAEPGVKA